MATLAWHGDYWGDDEDPEDPEGRQKPLRQEQEAMSLQGLLSILETLMLAQRALRPLQKDFGKNYKPPGYPAEFPITSAVMMAEIGLINLTYGSPRPLLQPQEVRPSPRPKVLDEPSWTEDYGEVIEWGVKAIALITAGAVMYQAGQKMPTRGYHFRAPSFSPLSANWPLWKIGNDNARLFITALKTGKGPEELLEELRRTRYSGGYVGRGMEMSEIGWIY